MSDESKTTGGAGSETALGQDGAGERETAPESANAPANGMDAAGDGKSAQSDGDAESDEKGKRPWSPNRVRKVRSKKSYDREKMDGLMGKGKKIYRGELDPRKDERKKKPRSISRSEEKLMAKAEALAEKDPLLAATRAPKLTDFRDQFEPCKASPGRLGALYATQQVRRRNAFAQEVIESTIDRSQLSDKDRAFATLLTLGVVSTLGALDDVINRCLASPSDIKPDVRDALRISTYEVIYLRKEPHAAVDQGVELVRAVAPSAAGLGNAVLHRVLKAADIFPFDDPTKSMQALALTNAFPTWMARRLIEDMGSKAAIELMRASNAAAPLFIHVNSLQATDEEIVSMFEEVGTEVEPASAGGVEVPGCYRVENARKLNDGRIKRLFQQGKILVSDAAAQAVALAVLEGGKPESILEVGSGRGTKTIMLQSNANRKFGEQLTLTAMDTHAFKSDLLRSRAQDYGVDIADIVTGNATRLDSVMPNRTFSTIFIDAPCSGLGTLRRHHEVRWRITPEQIDDLADTGLALLKSAAGHVDVGGSIVYSTCTVIYAENNGVVKAFLESEEGKGYQLAPLFGKACFTSTLTMGSPDAHFAAKFVRVR